MKRVIALFLAVVMAFTLCACGSTKITETELQEVLTSSDGTLKVDGSSNNIKNFEYKIEDANTEKLIDKDYDLKAINQLLTDYMQLTGYQYDVCKVYTALMSIDSLLNNSDENDFSAEKYLNKLTTVVCDGKTYKSGGWTISVVINQEDNTATIFGNK